MGCGCKKKPAQTTTQQTPQNVTIQLTEKKEGSATVITQTQQELVDKIVAKINDLDQESN